MGSGLWLHVRPALECLVWGVWSSLVWTCMSWHGLSGLRLGLGSLMTSGLDLYVMAWPVRSEAVSVQSELECPAHRVRQLSIHAVDAFQSALQCLVWGLW